MLVRECFSNTKGINKTTSYPKKGKTTLEQYCYNIWKRT